MRRVLASKGVDRVEYAVVRDASTLTPITPGKKGPMRALIAARVGIVRLIDNARWGKS
jgi:pantothenate synthetase